jgi:hypothetical protein
MIRLATRGACCCILLTAVDAVVQAGLYVLQQTLGVAQQGVIPLGTQTCIADAAS